MPTPKRHALHLYGIFVMGVMLCAVYFMLRIGLCWGRYGAMGTFLCNMHYLVALVMIFGVVLFGYLVVDIGRPHREAVRHLPMSHARAAYRGYKELGVSDTFHVTASMILALGFVIVALGAAMFAPFLF